MDKVRGALIRLCDNDNPPIVSRVISATATHKCCRNITH